MKQKMTAIAMTNKMNALTVIYIILSLKRITLDLEIGNTGVEMTEEVSNAISKLLSTTFVVDTILKWGVENSKTEEDIAKEIKTVIDDFINFIVIEEDTMELTSAKLVDKYSSFMHRANIDRECKLNNIFIDFDSEDIVEFMKNDSFVRIFNYLIHFMNSTGYTGLVSTIYPNKDINNILMEDIANIIPTLDNTTGNVDIVKLFSEYYTKKTADMLEKLKATHNKNKLKGDK
jgi:hypothetical protein